MALPTETREQRLERELREAKATFERNADELAAEEERWAIQDEASTVVKVLSLAPKPAFALLDGAGIAAPLPPIRWLCESLCLIAGGGRPLMISGYGDTGKTFALQELALAVAAGLPTVWGGVSIQLAGPVAHLDYEQGNFLTRWRYQRLAFGLNINLAALGERLRLSVMPSHNLVSPGTERHLTVLCTGLALLVVDNLNAACPGVDENASTAAEPLQMLGRVSERTGCCIVVLHHEGKPPAEGGRAAAHRMRGSSAIHGALGGAVSFVRDEGLVRVEPSKSPLGGQPEVRHFRFVDTGLHDENTKRSEGLRLEWLPPEQVSQEREKRQAKVAIPIRESLLAVITSQPGISKSAAVELAAGKSDSKRQAIAALISEGLVRIEIGPKNAIRLFVVGQQVAL